MELTFSKEETFKVDYFNCESLSTQTVVLIIYLIQIVAGNVQYFW